VQKLLVEHWPSVEHTEEILDLDGWLAVVQLDDNAR
jgi:hypothetical protein